MDINQIYNKIMQNDLLMYGVLAVIVLLVVFRRKIIGMYVAWKNRGKFPQAANQEVQDNDINQEELFDYIPNGKRTKAKSNTTSLPPSLITISDMLSKKADGIDVALRKDIEVLDKKRKIELRSLKQRKTDIATTKKDIEKLAFNLRNVYEQVCIQEKVADTLIENIEKVRS